jgi:hypothetical protein
VAGDAEHPGPDVGQHIERQQVHRVHEEDPDEHGQRQRGNEAAVAMHDRLGLRLDHFHQDFDGGLEAARVRRRWPWRRPRQDQYGQQAERYGPEQCIEMEYRPIDQRGLL